MKTKTNTLHKTGSHQVIASGLISLCVLASLPAPSQSGPISGLYQINSGTYSECCGFVGIPITKSLPIESQSFVRFQLDSPSQATLTFLAADQKTVLEAFSCPGSVPLRFDFSHGFVFPDYTFFMVDPGPQSYWSYAVSNSGPMLRIDGTLGATQSNCADVPTRFSHSNVVARLVLGPKLTLVERTKEQVTRIMIQGQAGWTDVLEASTDLKIWTPISTNVMDFSLCPICPFAVIEDPDQPGRTNRFYRGYEFK